MAAPSTLRNRKHHRQTLEGDASTIQEDALESIIISDSPVSSSSSKVIPLTQRPLLFRLDVGPFLLLYTALIACDILWQKDHGDDVRFMITVGLSVSLLMQLSLVLASTWSVSVQSTVGYARSPLSETSAIQHWTHAFIELEDDQLGIVAIEIDPILKIHTCKFHETVFHCDVQHRNLDQKLWTTNNSDNVQQQQGIQQPAPTAAAAAAADQALFQTRNYPIHLPLSFYSSWTGHASMESITKASIWYGLNQCLLEPPTFAQLLSQQVVAPFFLFQLFCVGLWCLDEYWYYAIYTLIALLLFESTVAYQRLASLQKLRRAGNHEGRVYCQRMIIQSTATATAAATAASNHSPKRQWIQLSTKELVPGDIVSLCATNRVYGTSSYTVPADILLLCGTAVCDEALLTGESVPQLKHALEINGKEDELLDIQDNEHKESILFAGTTLIATTNNKESDTDSNSNSNSNNTHIFSVPPDRGTVGMVLRTGFETTQGALLRTMAFSSKSADGVHTWDTFIFIFLLVCCAIAAAAFVLHNGWYDERRNRFRLLLHVVIIITSVVPPELPMELSLAVTNSVAALMQRCQVYCTEHFRIPWAGEVDVCCFDKTGTLTSDEMQLKGVCLQKDNAVATDLVKLKDAEDADENANESVLPWETLRVMVACHSLGTIGTGSKLSPITVVGDPLEKTVLKESGYRLVGDDTVARSDDAGLRKGARAIRILHRFAFSSKLKRMTTLATEEGGRDIVFALSKGAPETIKELLKSVPDEYDETARFHMSKGRRVLAMAYREAGHIHNLSKLKGLGRDELEKDLVFAGFLILDCPLKPDSKAVVTELRKSGHSVIMCTGDALLTAVEVARQVSIVKRKHKIHKIQLKARDGEMSSDVLSNFECVALDEKGDATSFCLSPSAVHQMTDMMGEASFCITGDVLVQLASVAVLGGQLKRHKMDEKHTLLHPDAQSVLSVLVPLISIFARHAPHHKEAVIAALNFGGHRTLMCGGKLFFARCFTVRLCIGSILSPAAWRLLHYYRRNKRCRRVKTSYCRDLYHICS
jgi:cation-transporting ATPase 13A1